MENKTELLIAIAFLCVVVFILGYITGKVDGRIATLKKILKQTSQPCKKTTK